LLSKIAQNGGDSDSPPGAASASRQPVRHAVPVEQLERRMAHCPKFLCYRARRICSATPGYIAAILAQTIRVRWNTT